METHYDFLCSIVQYLILITGLNIPFPFSRSCCALYEFDIGNYISQYSRQFLMLRSEWDRNHSTTRLDTPEQSDTRHAPHSGLLLLVSSPPSVRNP